MRIKKFSGDIFLLALSAYICTALFFMREYGKNSFDVDFTFNIGTSEFFLVFSALFSAFAIFYFLFRRLLRFQYYCLFISAFTLAISSVVNKNLNIYFNIAILTAMFFVILGVFGENKINLPENMLSTPVALAFLCTMVIIYVFVIFEATYLRFRVYAASTYDFGIFAQMFENMAKTGRQLTTLERNVLLSHFEVHFSPIYYLLLPGYLLFRNPNYLLLVQALFIAAGAFPVFLTAKKFKLSNEHSVLISVAYLFYPTLTGGVFFDFHENKFLTFLILWLFYFLVSEKIIPVYIFSLLTLTVKEDSFIYVFFIAVYIIFYGARKNKKLIKHGVIIAALSLMYFAGAIFYLRSNSQGIMLYRLNVFLAPGQDSIVDAILNVLKNPMLIFSSLLHEEKLKFVLYMLLPLCFMPFVSKNLEFLILIIPVVIINLATDYVYQYNIDFQYAYGSAAIFIFLAIKNVSRLKKDAVEKICAAMLCFSCILFMSNNYNKIDRYHFIYNNFKADFIEADVMLEKIPDSASVAASTFLTPHLIDHEEVYMLEINTSNISNFYTDYILIDLRYIDLERYSLLRERLLERGYLKVDGGIVIDVYERQE